MAQRPNFIDLGPGAINGTARSTGSTPSGMSSPRVAHLAGEVPPAMSPLDAFAAQSRLLAKKLDDSRKNGRRVSRLEPYTVASSLAQPRPGYFRNISGDSDADAEHQDRTSHDEATGNKMEVEDPIFRPKSYYPQLSRMSQASPIPSPALVDQDFSTPSENVPVKAANDYFGAAVRAQSPELVASPRNSIEAISPSRRSQKSFDSSSRKSELQRGLSIESTASSSSHYAHSLQPPRPSYVRQTPSIRSIPMDSSDDENTGYAVSSSSRDRKLSSSSAFSIPQSPLSPFVQHHARSPSVTSEYSVGGTRLPRPAYNFSRPLSHSSRPSMEFPSRKPSSDSHSFMSGDSAVQTPLSVDNEFFEAKEHQAAPAPSYIYAKFSLPRGRMLNNNLVHDDTEMPSFEWEQQLPQKGPQTNLITATPPVESHIDSSLPTPPHSIQSDDVRPTTPERSSAEYENTGRPRSPPIPVSTNLHRQSMTSMNSGSTIKASPPRTITASTELTAEDHLTKGIDCHERGSLKESTYHLRIAARQNHPTAMLLYALACRHGWGMRQSPKEGVQWLRKAMDSASIELGDDNPAAIRGNRGPQDYQDQKTRRAHFALSVYELGVSHMNGWGTEQDKSLALRCFEIAANWGDADAMAEAGFCYAQAVGCKKDLKKAAKYYRMAEAKGMSMVGNSWYVLL